MFWLFEGLNPLTPLHLALILSSYLLVKENGESETPCNYPTVSNIPKTDVLSPSNGTSESNYQKRWQHWQQHQHTSGELLKTSSKVRFE